MLVFLKRHNKLIIKFVYSLHDFKLNIKKYFKILS